MNSLVVSELVLAIAAFGLATTRFRRSKGLALAAAIIGIAAVLGALRFSNVLPMVELHQLFAVFSSTVALPLIAVSLIWPNGVVATRLRYVSIFAIATAVAAIVIVTLKEVSWWASVSAAAAAVAITVSGFTEQRWLRSVIGAVLFGTLLAFFYKWRIPSLAPGDTLHYGLAIAMLLIWRASRS